MPVARRHGVTRANAPLQGPPAPTRHAWPAAGLALLALLGGCAGSGGGSLNPVDWWHGLEGGRIAEARPPPPNADAPYANLGTVPAKPPPPDAAMHANVQGGLVADRRNAQYEQKTQPLAGAPVPAATPAATRAQGARPTDSEQPNASLAAANGPKPVPPSQTPPPSGPVVTKKAPVAAVTSAPLDAPAPAPAPTPVETAAAPAPAAPAVAADFPAVPESPPLPPQLAGAAPEVVVPTPPPVAPPVPPPPPPVPSPDGPPVPIPFAAGSAVLQSDALVPIKLLARRRGNSHISVTGFGEATSSDTTVQTAALPLALDRARAIAAQLMASGVPSWAINIAAEPQGSGAAARLVN